MNDYNLFKNFNIPSSPENDQLKEKNQQKEKAQKSDETSFAIDKLGKTIGKNVSIENDSNLINKKNRNISKINDYNNLNINHFSKSISKDKQFDILQKKLSLMLENDSEEVLGFEIGENIADLAIECAGHPNSSEVNNKSLCWLTTNMPSKLPLFIEASLKQKSNEFLISNAIKTFIKKQDYQSVLTFMFYLNRETLPVFSKIQKQSNEVLDQIIPLIQSDCSAFEGGLRVVQLRKDIAVLAEQISNEALIHKTPLSVKSVSFFSKLLDRVNGESKTGIPLTIENLNLPTIRWFTENYPEEAVAYISKQKFFDLPASAFQPFIKISPDVALDYAKTNMQNKVVVKLFLKGFVENNYCEHALQLLSAVKETSSGPDAWHLVSHAVSDEPEKWARPILNSVNFFDSNDGNFYQLLSMLPELPPSAGEGNNQMV